MEVYISLRDARAEIIYGKRQRKHIIGLNAWNHDTDETNICEQTEYDKADWNCYHIWNKYPHSVGLQTFVNVVPSEWNNKAILVLWIFMQLATYGRVLRKYWAWKLINSFENVLTLHCYSYIQQQQHVASMMTLKLSFYEWIVNMSLKIDLKTFFTSQFMWYYARIDRDYRRVWTYRTEFTDNFKVGPNNKGKSVFKQSWGDVSTIKNVVVDIRSNEKIWRHSHSPKCSVSHFQSHHCIWWTDGLMRLCVFEQILNCLLNNMETTK